MYFLKISRARAFNSDTNMILLIEIGYIHTGRKDARGKNSKISVVSEVPLGTKKKPAIGATDPWGWGKNADGGYLPC